MSRIIASQLQIGTVGPVNLEEYPTFEKFEHQRVKVVSDGRFQIKFYKEKPIDGNNVTWKYASKCDRDAEYQKILDLPEVTIL